MELNVRDIDVKESILKKSERWWISLGDAEGKPDLKASKVNFRSVDSSIPVAMEVDESGRQGNGLKITKGTDESPELSDGEESEEEVGEVEPSAPKEGPDVVICVPVNEGRGIEQGKRGEGNVEKKGVARPQEHDIGVLFGGERERDIPTEGKLTKEYFNTITAEKEEGNLCLKRTSIECGPKKGVESLPSVSLGVDTLDECPKDAGIIKTNANGANPVEVVGKEYLPDVSVSETISPNHSTKSKEINPLANESQIESSLEVLTVKEKSTFTMKENVLFSETLTIDERKGGLDNKFSNSESNPNEGEIIGGSEDIDNEMNIEGIILKSLHEMSVSEEFRRSTKEAFCKTYDELSQFPRRSKDSHEFRSRNAYIGSHITNYHDFQKEEDIFLQKKSSESKKSSEISIDIRGEKVIKNSFYSDSAARIAFQKSELNKIGGDCFAGDLETEIGGKRLRIYFQSAEDAREVVKRTNSMKRGRNPLLLKISGYEGVSTRGSIVSFKKHLRHESHKSSGTKVADSKNQKRKMNTATKVGRAREKNMDGDKVEYPKIFGEKMSEECVEAEIFVQNYENNDILRTPEDIQKMAIGQIKLDQVTNIVENESEASTADTDTEVISFERERKISCTDKNIKTKIWKIYGGYRKVVEDKEAYKGNSDAGTRWRTAAADEDVNEKSKRNRNFLRQTSKENFSFYKPKKATENYLMKSIPRNKLKLITGTGLTRNKETFGRRMRNLFSATINRLRQ